jgi:hypothetical protein
MTTSTTLCERIRRLIRLLTKSEPKLESSSQMITV